MYKRFIVPLDGSDTAQQVIPYLRLMGEGFKASVELLAVVPGAADIMRAFSTGDAIEDEDVGGAYSQLLSIERIDEIRATLQKESHARLKRTAVSLRSDGIMVETKVLEGNPAEAILGEVEEVPDALVAIATHGRSGLRRWALGSVTDKVIRHSERPVFVVRAQEGAAPEGVTLRGIILPLDGSPAAEDALTHAAAVATALNLPITLVRAVPTSGTGHSFVDVEQADYADLLPTVEGAAQKYLEDAAERLRGMGVRVADARLVDESPDEAIIDAAGDAADQLIVMSSHGRTGVSRWTLGSVTDRVVRNGSGPVLVVRNKQQDVG